MTYHYKITSISTNKCEIIESDLTPDTLRVMIDTDYFIKKVKSPYQNLFSIVRYPNYRITLVNITEYIFHQKQKQQKYNKIKDFVLHFELYRDEYYCRCGSFVKVGSFPQHILTNKHKNKLQERLDETKAKMNINNFIN